MKITHSTVTKLVISDIMKSHSLDPVTVIVEDIGPRQGKIIIECYGKSWSAYWGGCGDYGVAAFFCSCSADYLANCLDRGIQFSKYDPTQIADQLKTLVLQRRRVASQWTSGLRRRYWTHPYDHDPLEKEEAREIWNRIDLEAFHDDPWGNAGLFTELFGEEWWYSLPEAPNPDYQYLCRIVTAVQQAFLQMKETANG